LNSGDARKYDEAALWQNAIEPRLHPFSETVQFQLLDRWKALGQTVELVLQTPTFDDNTPAWDIMVKSIDQPVTWNERRALVGLDPLPDYEPDGITPLGVRIDMSIKITQTAFGPGEDGTFTQAPTPQVTVTPRETALLTEGKATLRAPFGHVRDQVEGTVTPKIQAAVQKYLADQRDAVVARIREKIEHILHKPTDASWIGRWDDKLRAALMPELEPVAVKITAEAATVLGKPQKAATEFDTRVLAFVQGRVGERITGINETSRDAVLDVVKQTITEATQEGLSPAATADILTERVKGLTVWNDARAEMIARTELMNAYNDAALQSYREYDVSQVVAMDGDKDEECASRDGNTYSIDDASNITDHPNGTLDWAPVKASLSRAVMRDAA